MLTIGGVYFGFYAPDDIKKLSVKRITNPIAFDSLKVPQKDGLYDPALGPVGHRDRSGHILSWKCLADRQWCSQLSDLQVELSRLSWSHGSH